MRYYNVFWQGDVENIKKSQKSKKVAEVDINAESVLNNYLKNNSGLKFIPKYGDEAYYSPSKDVVVVPKIGQFNNTSEYYSTVFHELIHSTGHKNRLDRNFKSTTRFGDCDYSKEELVAEIGASYLCSVSNVEDKDSFKNNVGYIQGWLKALENNNRLVVSAASKAQKASEYVLKRA